MTDLSRSAPPNVRVEAAANRLLTALRTRTPCSPVRDLIGSDDVDAAYAVQRRLTERRQAEGASIVGRKIGLTAPAVQAQLGVDQPDFGVLFDDMSRAEGPLDISALLQPKIEAEVAFVLGGDLDDPDADASSVRAAVEYAVAALEIVDSRIAGWDISFADTVADNASSGLFVLGSRPLPLDAVEPRTVAMTMTMDGEPASSGQGTACLGDPLAALAWLARTAARFGDPLRAGDVVLSGALGPMAALRPGVVVHADIGPLGEVTCTAEGSA
ncbi:MAG TPA: fumarylacetoacetate hydrolase family protein [Pseudonocardiaceae bacterium]|nr:fumarylacetoacetate hydrolase family protein [Pseudonocardiaceae bacterium]